MKQTFQSRAGNIDVVGKDIIDGVRKIFADDTLCIEEKQTRFEHAQNATNLILDKWCTFSSKKEQEQTKYTLNILLGLIAIEETLRPVAQRLNQTIQPKEKTS